MTASIILCADDYGLSAGQSQAIVQLAERRRISAASAIVTASSWRADATALCAMRPTLALGLHINVTDGVPLGNMARFAPDGTLPSLPRVILGSLMRRLPCDELRDEIARQLRAFEHAVGDLPDFIDGHQHVHALPQVSDCLFDVLKHVDPLRRILLRDPTDAWSRILARRSAVAKASVLTLLTQTFGSKARAHGYRTNDGFSGVSHFVPTCKAVTLDFQHASKNLGPFHVMMCHPGLPVSSHASESSLGVRRSLEFSALMSQEVLLERVWLPERDAHGSIIWPSADVDCEQ
ncbi:MAG: hypothetical protein CTY31_04610 [Hyphomicrobium sp.]|nr:MAG: hypothetical protein CTY39_04325 [Hyphomicrobium sp.]PPD00421.1 MAG: hypothetical protein CTY31_04610 [Hyphomicrobium sp.]